MNKRKIRILITSRILKKECSLEIDFPLGESINKNTRHKYKSMSDVKSNFLWSPYFAEGSFK